MRTRTLLTQVLAVNTALVAGTAIVAAVIARGRFQDVFSLQRMLLLGLAVSSAVLLNSLLLRRRLRPLERLLHTMERVDLSRPGQRAATPAGAATEVERLTADFNRMMSRLEEERRESGRAVIRAQEEERARIAQDLHDEVNQALTAILLRLEALAQETPPERAPEVVELKRLVNQAMDELLNLARQLRPSALDDHGLVAALETQMKRFSARTGIEARLDTAGDPDELADVIQTAIYRVAQEALTNVTRHAGATVVELIVAQKNGDVELRVSDDGRGFDPAVRGGGLGLIGMAERARLVGGELDVRSAPGGGTTITLRVPT
jgi:two-component system, NarL family, sensor histidine kinase UhpB